LISETQLTYVLVAGVALFAIGLFWLIVAAFRVKWYWGLAVLLFPPIGLIFALRIHVRKEAAWPLVFLAVGLVVGAAPIAYNRFLPIDLGPHESMVDNELHITLTKWDRKDYSVLGARPGAVVVQMANPDVTDQTLTYLRGMKRLRELDLNGTQVSDEGLRELEGLLDLATLRLKNTKITDAGFQKWLAARESLMLIDLRGTKVSKETGKTWKAARPDRTLFQ
jgi:hypothetical protein